jgi:hypothetical protein
MLPFLSRQELRATPMVPTMSFHQSSLSAAMRSLCVSHGVRTLPFHTTPEQRLALAWLGLLLGIFVLAPQGVPVAWLSPERPRMIAHDPGSAPWVMRLVTGVFPTLSRSCDAGYLSHRASGQTSHHCHKKFASTPSTSGGETSTLTRVLREG